MPAIKDYSFGRSNIKKLREAVNPTGKRGSWLKDLNDRQLVEVYNQLMAGAKPYALVKTIQKKWNIKVGEDPGPLSRALRNFKKKTVGLLQIAKEEAKRTDTPMVKREVASLCAQARKAAEKMNTFKLMQDIALYEHNRYFQAAQKERELGTLMVETSKIGSIAVSALRNVADLQERLGIPDQEVVRQNKRIEDAFNKLMDNTDSPEEIANLCAESIETILTECIELSPGKDGKWVEKGGDDEQ